jgi:hypothetical protein
MKAPMKLPVRAAIADRFVQGGDTGEARPKLVAPAAPTRRLTLDLPEESTRPSKSRRSKSRRR